MIHNKIHLISPGFPRPSITLQVQNCVRKHHSSHFVGSIDYLLAELCFVLFSSLFFFNYVRNLQICFYGTFRCLGTISYAPGHMYRHSKLAAAHWSLCGGVIRCQAITASSLGQFFRNRNFKHREQEM